MNWLDILIIVVVAWFTFTGLTSGLIREVINLGGLFGGVFLAGRYYSELAERLAFISNPDVVKVISFLLIFFAVTITAHLLMSILRRVVSFLFLGWVDHLGGAILGFAKGALLCQSVLIAFTQFPFLDIGTTIADSRLAPYFLKTFPLLLGLLPQEFEAVKRFFG